MNKVREKRGYIMLKENSIERPLHDIIMERLIGRSLYKNEVVHHDDENRANNTPSNLILMTRPAHNKLHALRRVRSGINYDISLHSAKGEQHPRSKLNESDVIKILNNDNSQSKIALEFGVSKSCIKHIKRGRNWSHLKNKLT